ncbi:MAG: phage tail protein [Calditrichaeota bacterium]|nr:phage tail protein [Calditrichota bacterium]
MAKRTSIDPYTAFKFEVVIANFPVGGFSEVTGLQAETEVEDIREGGVNNYTHKFVKIAKYHNLVLKRGITEEQRLWEWYLDVAEKGVIEKRDITVILNDRYNQRQKTWQWTFSNAYPVKWVGSDLNATRDVLFIETIEFAHHGMKKGAG